MSAATLMPPPTGSEPKYISYEDFLELDLENPHVEWVDGEEIEMSPVSNEHNELGLWLIRIVSAYVEARELGKVRYEPFQMKTGPNLPGRSPDIMFISSVNLHRLQKNYLDGPADAVVEIISPGSGGVDRGVKFDEYEAGGVKEYWVIDPVRTRADFNRLDANGRYRNVPTPDGVFHSEALPGFWMKVDWLWAETQPTVLQVLREWGLL